MKHISILSTLTLLLLVYSCAENKDDIQEEMMVNATEKEIDKNLVANSTEEATEIVDNEEVVCEESLLTVFLDDPDLTGTNIRKKPKGEVAVKLILDENNIGFMMDICEEKNGWLRIKGSIIGDRDEIDLPDQSGWIHHSVVSVGTRNYGGQEIPLIDEPNGTKQTGAILRESYGVKIIGLCGEWVKIQHNKNNGWVKAEWLCGNPFTTCS